MNWFFAAAWLECDKLKFSTFSVRGVAEIKLLKSELCVKLPAACGVEQCTRRREITFSIYQKFDNAPLEKKQASSSHFFPVSAAVKVVFEKRARCRHPTNVMSCRSIYTRGRGGSSLERIKRPHSRKELLTKTNKILKLQT